MYLCIYYLFLKHTRTAELDVLIMEALVGEGGIDVLETEAKALLPNSSNLAVQPKHVRDGLQAMIHRDLAYWADPGLFANLSKMLDMFTTLARGRPLPRPAILTESPFLTEVGGSMQFFFQYDDVDPESGLQLRVHGRPAMILKLKEIEERVLARDKELKPEHCTDLQVFHHLLDRDEKARLETATAEIEKIHMANNVLAVREKLDPKNALPDAHGVVALSSSVIKGKEAKEKAKETQASKSSNSSSAPVVVPQKRKSLFGR